ncbi:hypothetical protein EVB41_014 [Rhizobium phage RHph_TM3_14A]|nr:hypothetical protein EVB29_014 [Rhizobium phage RHph_TM27A]QIG66934.1 hypothetical protein EVB30_014 [Rhizobium phage RHph_TM27B]QIG67024.1 hypothetical protein EVB31_014 [Rhizobium phage RHph_TM29]QIG67479.1 hypothetical protein EVB41_014 [Rhizobium phage RHph_TM3_14A]
MQPQDALTHKAAALARAAPDLWRDFLQALAEYTEHHRENLVRSQLAELPINQGRAQMLTVLTAHLNDCLTNAEKMNKKER